MPAGSYHVVLDESRVDNEDSNTGLTLNQLDSFGNELARVLWVNEIEYRVRSSSFVTFDSAATFRISVKPNFEAEDYVLGIFENGSGVPSPYFEECPSIVDLPMDVETSIFLDAASQSSEVWYRAEVLAGDFRFTSDATRQGNDSGNIMYDIMALDQFGQEVRSEQISWINKVDTSYRSSDVWSATEAKPVWIRYRNGFRYPLNVKFTATEE